MMFGWSGRVGLVGGLCLLGCGDDAATTSAGSSTSGTTDVLTSTSGVPTTGSDDTTAPTSGISATGSGTTETSAAPTTGPGETLDTTTSTSGDTTTDGTTGDDGSTGTQGTTTTSPTTTAPTTTMGATSQDDADSSTTEPLVCNGASLRVVSFNVKSVGAEGSDEWDALGSLLARLALTYFADEQHAHGIAVHRILLASLPEAPERCDWQTRIVLASSQQTDHAATIREAERLADVWLSMRDGNDRQAVKRRCRDAALEILPELAMRWHDAADETGAPASHARSEQLYTTFLGVFPLAIEARAVRAWLADLQWSHAARMADYPPTRDAARRMFAAVAVAFTALFVDRPEHIDVHTLARAAEHARCNARALRDAP